MRMSGTLVAIGLNGPRNLVRRVGLQIEAVDVAAPAVLHDEDAGANAAPGRLRRGRSARACRSCGSPSPSGH